MLVLSDEGRHGALWGVMGCYGYYVAPYGTLVGPLINFLIICYFPFNVETYGL